MSDPRYEKVGDVLDRLVEEAAEVIQAVQKIKRFGLNNWHPDDPKKTPNYVLLECELADLERVAKEIEGNSCFMIPVSLIAWPLVLGVFCAGLVGHWSDELEKKKFPNPFYTEQEKGEKS